MSEASFVRVDAVTYGSTRLQGWSFLVFYDGSFQGREERRRTLSGVAFGRTHMIVRLTQSWFISKISFDVIVLTISMKCMCRRQEVRRRKETQCFGFMRL